jgi:ABC-2 type transport system permease protein
VVGSPVLLVVAVAATYRLGAVVYQRAIVRTGRRLKLGEVLRPAR